jgi:hypothetical protein
MEEAVGQFYDNPDKYAQSPVAVAVAVPDPTSPSNPKMGPGEAKNPTYSPPVYAPPVGAMGATHRRHHSNAVIEAGHVRARDEVGFACPCPIVIEKADCRSTASKRCRISCRVSSRHMASTIAISNPNTRRTIIVAVLFTSTKAEN